MGRLRTRERKMKNITNTSYHELDKKNNNSRIWLEGEPLTRAGFEPGGFYSMALNIDTLEATMTFVADSPEARKLWREKKLRKVSGRKMVGWVKPIIDVCNADITQVFGPYGRFRAQAFSNGVITFSVHHEEFARVEREETFKANYKNCLLYTSDAADE